MARPTAPGRSDRGQATDRGRAADRKLGALLAAAATLSGTLLLFVVAFVGLEAVPALRDPGVGRFFTDPAWSPSQRQFRLVPMLVGMALTALGALGVAGGLGIAVAVFCRFYAPPRIARAYRAGLAVLAGIPSVVFGLWGLLAVVPWIARLNGPGPSLLAAILVLTLMTLPTVALTADGALRGVPRDLVRGAAALGLRRRAVVTRIALPAARRGIGVGLLLAFARAIGETMAVVMVAGNVPRVPDSPFAPVRTVTANIALEMGYATAAHRSILFASAAILLGIVVGFTMLGAAFRPRTGSRS